MGKDYLDITLLIQCLQRAEGNPDCFRRIRDECSEIHCCWRPYCLDEPQTVYRDSKSLGDAPPVEHLTGIFGGWSGGERDSQ